MFDLTDKFLQFALLGANWVLWVLVLLSVASVAIAIERFLFYRSVAGQDNSLVKPLHNALSSGDVEEAVTLAKSRDSAGARMVVEMLEVHDKGAKAVQAMADAARPAERVRLERNLNFLGTVGSNAPFIGLFGTVIEILAVFDKYQGDQNAEAVTELMSGISAALVATAIGLLVAIPAVIFYNVFQRRVKRLMGEAESLTQMVVAQLAK